MKKVKYPYQQVYYRKHDVLQRDCVCKKKERIIPCESLPRKSNKEEGELMGSITINKEVSKDDTLIITNTFQYDDNGKEVGKSIGYEIKKEEPKPECDHIVGVYNDYGFVLEVSQSMCSVNSDWSNYDREEFILEKKYCHSHFYFCPKKGCGAPIDWEEIEKKLNLKKDE